MIQKGNAYVDLLPFTETHLWLEVDHYAASFRIRSFREKDERKDKKGKWQFFLLTVTMTYKL